MSNPYARPLIVVLVCLVIGVVLFAINGWRDSSQWSFGSRLLGMALLGVGLFAMIGADVSESRRAAARSEERALRWDPGLTPPEPVPFRQTALWVLGGAIPAFVLAELVLSDQSIARSLGPVITMLLVFAGGLLGLYLSPGVRADRDFREHLKEVDRRQGRTDEVRYQEDEVEADPRKRQELWRKRVYDACLWWSSTGEKLHTDSDYLVALVQGVLPYNLDYKKVEETYSDANDPCANTERARQVASWAVENLAELIADHTSQASDRTVEGVTRILRHHHKRDVRLYNECHAYYLHQSKEALKGESPTELVERFLRQFSAGALARERGLERVRALATKYALPAERADFIKNASAGVVALVDTWLKAQKEALV